MDAQIGTESKVLGKLFALVTSKLEDAVELAARGQAPEVEARPELANQLIDICTEVQIISEAALLIMAPDNS